MTFDQPWHQADAGIPQTRYTRSGDVHIAYQTLGGGPGDLVFVAGFTSHCEHQWEQPDLARSLRRMGPARAVHCAQAITGAVACLGLRIRAGVHTGEVELLDSDIGGIAVHIAARVDALAAPGEVLVSRTVKDLVAGSGIRFVDRGAHTLKGIDESWQLLAAA